MKMKAMRMKVILCMFFGVAFISIGAMGYEDELAEESNYCKMVNSGSWGAYRDDVDCEEVGEEL